jgi:beta-galactosidase
MKRNFCYTPIFAWLIMALIITGCKSDDHFVSTNRDHLFNEGWKFIRDSLPYRQAGITGAEQPGYDDTQWMTLDLPHDWSVSKLPGEENQDQTGPFSKSSPGATATGYVMGGTAWYRKHFKLDKADAGKIVVLKFDGVYMESEVWVNGKPAGNHVYGYTPFWFDITALLNKTGKENVIAVKVNNTGRNSRWYSGSGIYRNVYLTITDPVHVSVWGVHVTASEITANAANVNLAVTVQHDADYAVDALIAVRILAPDATVTEVAEGTLKINARDKSVFRQKIILEKPVLWSVSSPGLYQAEVTVESGGKITDRFTQSFGIRSIEVTAEKGFLLNGEPLELKGGCMHHDNGLLGSAAFERAEERRVEIMKANGFNAIRTSHNPPSEAFLNACDHLGMLVIDETFDIWERPKNPQDYHRFFKTWWKKDVEAMIMRDRNHPSVICWSIGNEINERADTSGIRIAKSIISFIQQMDTTRPFTNAICEFWDNQGTPWDTTANAFELLTVGGYNYQYLRYESDHEKFPGRIMMGTESVPKDAFDNWQQVEKHAYVIGDFVWTGMDYLGETGIGHTQYFTEGQQDVFAMPWPWFNAWCGDIDIIGDKKPQMIYRDVIWGNSKLEINVHAPVPGGKTEKVSYWGWPDEYPNWNWSGNEDKPLQVSVYTKGTAVRLMLNGREIGYKEVSPGTKLTAIFDVPYEPGELKAVAYQNGEEIAVKVLKTTGVPAGIRIKADRNNIKADRNDLSYITIEIIDEFGQVVTDAARQVKLTLSGNGELIGSGNACPFDMKSFGKPVITTFHGKAMAIVRPYAKTGTIMLKAVGEGLKEGNIAIKAE